MRLQGGNIAASNQKLVGVRRFGFDFQSPGSLVSLARLQGPKPQVRENDSASHGMEFIDLKAQYHQYQAEIDARMRRVLEHGQFIMGPEIQELEKVLAEYVGVAHCITVASGTASLEIALRALGIGPGDEVVTVPFTWISTAEVIALVGAKPVFVDIDPVTFNLDPSGLSKILSPRVKAIIPVSLFGQMADFDPINRIAHAHNLPVIEDAAQSFGASQNGKRSCGVTSISSTSFFPAKPFGCYGDGGALFTNDAALAERMRAIRTHGGLKRHQHPWVGTNGRFDTLQAAVLLAKWPHFEWELKQRQQLGSRYSEKLRPFCHVPELRPGNTHVYAQYTVRCAHREQVAERLKAKSIPTAVYYPKCLHQQPVFAGLGYRDGDFPHAEKAAQEVLSLPMHPFLSESEQDRVIAALQAAIDSKPK